MKKETNIVEIKCEIEDGYSDDSLFNISSWGADLSFRELCAMYEENELVKPELQRKYVWDRFEASRFIESILMGLPVPSVFLAQAGSEKLIVDGYQRIMTVYDYIRGIFSKDNKIFRLSNTEKINKLWRNKAFSELSSDDQRKIRSTTIHAIVFEQKEPKDNDTSLYQIFERINTSGRTLTAQEIRNCVYQGKLNRLLFELNANATWRSLWGGTDEDSRMRDIENILRFFVMKSDKIRNCTLNRISLQKEINEFMGEYRNAPDEILDLFRKEFLSTMEAIKASLGDNAFRNISKNRFTKKFHPAIFDAIAVAFYQLISENRTICVSPREAQISILSNSDFQSATASKTTDIENIKKRVRIAYEHFGG